MNRAQSATGPAVVSRMAAALFALLGALVALYLLLYDLGVSSLACPISGCEVVQASAYSKLFGVPVAAFGVAGFAALLATAVAGLSGERWLGLPVQGTLVALSSAGVLAYLVLTALEAFVIRAWCFWCVTSSLMMLGVWVSGLAGALARARNR